MLTEIIENFTITPRLFVLTVRWEGVVLPGQFFMLHTPSDAQILPRPISVFDWSKEDKTLSFLIGVYGKGTALLQELKMGCTLKIDGPYGNGFPTEIKGANILLIGGAEGIAPMFLAAKSLLYYNTVRLFAGFKTKADADVLKFFAPYADELEISYTVQEENGGLVTSLIEEASPAQAAFICGSGPMMKACVQAMKPWKSTRIFVSLDSRMACGVGACMGCTVKGKRGKALRPCSQGPVFEAKEVF